MPRVAAQSAQQTDALLREVVRLFSQAQRVMTDCCTGATAKECQALLLLGQCATPLTVLEFAERMGLEKTWASRLVGRMEKNGHVKRLAHPDDGRSWLIKLTAKGCSEQQTLADNLNQHAIGLLGCVPAAERANVERALVHLRDALSQCLEQCSPDQNCP